MNSRVDGRIDVTRDTAINLQLRGIINTDNPGSPNTQFGTPAAIPYAVGLYITAAYWFTASTSFANPAVTIARALSDTYAGIAPAGIAAFIAAQIVGALLAVALARWLFAR